jgi:hypothetical protein
MLNEGGMDLFRQIVCNMITALGMPAINEDELDDLTSALVTQVSCESILKSNC